MKTIFLNQTVNTDLNNAFIDELCQDIYAKWFKAT